ncbi:hypothetical protein MASR1M74_22520 [Lentimicrobium sp.]
MLTAGISSDGIFPTPWKPAERLDFILSNYEKAESVAVEGQKLVFEEYDSTKQAHLIEFFI